MICILTLGKRSIEKISIGSWSWVQSNHFKCWHRFMLQCSGMAFKDFLIQIERDGSWQPISKLGCHDASIQEFARLPDFQSSHDPWIVSCQKLWCLQRISHPSMISCSCHLARMMTSPPYWKECPLHPWRPWIMWTTSTTSMHLPETIYVFFVYGWSVSFKYQTETE